MRTIRAMALLCGARVAVDHVRFERWVRWLSGRRAPRKTPSERAQQRARENAALIERSAERLPISIRCLPRAMALSWVLRSEGVDHALVIAVRPPRLRGREDSLHAWVEVKGETVIGSLPGPWLETLRLSG